LIMILILQH